MTGDGECIRVLTVDTQLEGLHPPEQEVRRERRQAGSVDLPVPEDGIDQRMVAAHDATHGIGVASEELRCTVYDEIGAEVEGALVDRRREGVVHNDQRTGIPCRCGETLDVGQLECWVRRRLQVDELATRGDLRFDPTLVRGIAQCDLDTETRQVLGVQPRRSPVCVLHRHDPVAR